MSGKFNFEIEQQRLDERRLSADREQALHKALTEWMDEGERIFGGRGLGLMFRLGAWWADRPWRARKGVKP